MTFLGGPREPALPTQECHGIRDSLPTNACQRTWLCPPEAHAQAEYVGPSQPRSTTTLRPQYDRKRSSSPNGSQRVFPYIAGIFRHGQHCSTALRQISGLGVRFPRGAQLRPPQLLASSPLSNLFKITDDRSSPQKVRMIFGGVAVTCPPPTIRAFCNAGHRSSSPPHRDLRIEARWSVMRCARKSPSRSPSQAADDPGAITHHSPMT